jgi:hypothetical protein
MAEADALSARVAALEQAAAAIRADVARLSERFDSQAQSLQTLDGKVDAVFRSLTEQHHVFIEIQAQQATYIEKSVKKLKERQREQALDLLQLRNAVRALQLGPPPPPKATASADSPALLRLEYGRGAPLSGIISFLTAKYGQNVHDSGEVTVTGSAYSDDPDFAPKNAADLADMNSRFFSACGRDQWITFEFKRSAVRPTHYSLRSGQFGCDLKSWTIEGSSDGATWRLLDAQEDNESLEGESAVATFEVAGAEEVRFLRLRQTGPAHDGSHQITITGFELFGDLREVDQL